METYSALKDDVPISKTIKILNATTLRRYRIYQKEL